MTETFRRQVACKIWISDLVTGQYVKSKGDYEPNFVIVRDKNISRVNLIANVIMKYDSENFVSITLDDGSATVKVNAWREDVKMMSALKIGDIVNVIGKVRENNLEIFLAPEIVKVLDNPNWELVRKLELYKEYGKPSFNETTTVVVPKDVKEDVIEEIVVTEAVRSKILRAIEKLDAADGVLVSDLLKECGDDGYATAALRELIIEGEIYEPRPGRVKLLD
ncbi:hypothetical protein J4468_02125 [Candidatus Woesearchaeota archaeon]|nr:hypothetical protein [Candidatus Woesearchaeota archaeon]